MFLLKILRVNDFYLLLWTCCMMQKVSSKPAATMKVMLRTIKLFLLGLILQGILFFHLKLNPLNKLMTRAFAFALSIT